MPNKKILVIFDFCDTLFDGQSVNYFLDFLYSKLPFYKKILSKTRRKLNKISSSESKKYKEYLLKDFCGMSEQKFEIYAKDFFDEVIQYRLHDKVIKKLQYHKGLGHTLVVASGGFECYLKYFVKKYEMDLLFCTKLEFVNGRLTSKIMQNECLGGEKINRLKTLKLEKYDLKNSYVYSDHRSDIPLFDLVGNKVLVKNKQDVSWIDHNYKVLSVDD